MWNVCVILDKSQNLYHSESFLEKIFVYEEI